MGIGGKPVGEDKNQVSGSDESEIEDVLAEGIKGETHALGNGDTRPDFTASLTGNGDTRP